MKEKQTDSFDVQKVKDLIDDLTKINEEDRLHGMVAVDYYDGENVYFYKPEPFIFLYKKPKESMDK